MLLTCPHCGYLAALILPAAADAAAPRCPRCDGNLRVDPVATASVVQAVTMADAAAADADVDTDPAADADAALDAAVDADVATSAATQAITKTGDADWAAANANATASAPGNAGADVLKDPPDIPDTPDSTPPVARRRRNKPRPPSFVREHAPIAAAARLTWPRLAAIVALGGLLVLQLLLAQRHELAASARWRPWVAGLCHVLPCTVPAWHEPRAYTMLNRSVLPSRTAAGVLSVEARFRNDARWPQPWPTLVLTLADVEGRPVGMRAFAPADYRPATRRAGSVGSGDLLAPGQAGSARLLVREPVAGIVAFTFDFQ